MCGWGMAGWSGAGRSGSSKGRGWLGEVRCGKATGGWGGRHEGCEGYGVEPGQNHRNVERGVPDLVTRSSTQAVAVVAATNNDGPLTS